MAPEGGHGEPRGVRSSSNGNIYRLQQPFLIWGNTAPELQARSPTHGFKQTTNVPWQRLSMCNRGSRSPYLNLTKQPRCPRMCLRRNTSICCQVVRPTVSVELAVDVHDPSVHTPSATHVYYSPKVGPKRGFGRTILMGWKFFGRIGPAGRFHSNARKASGEALLIKKAG